MIFVGVGTIPTIAAIAKVGFENEMDTKICGATIVDYKGVPHECQRKPRHKRQHLDSRDGFIAEWSDRDAQKLAAYHEQQKVK